jgi:hypothetical protein
MKFQPAPRLPRSVLYAVDESETNSAIQDLIRHRAYELYDARGRQPGHDVEDWLQAEREIGRHWGNARQPE